MATTERIARISVNDVQRSSRGRVTETRPNGGGNRRRSNNRRRNKSNDSNNGEQKLVLRDRKLGGGGTGPIRSKNNGPRSARDRGRGYSPARNRPAPFEQNSTVWEFQQRDRSDQQQSMAMSMMQVPINTLATMGQAPSHLNVPTYCIIPSDNFQQQQHLQQQQSINNPFIQQQQDQQQRSVQLQSSSHPMIYQNVLGPGPSNFQRDQIPSSDIQNDRDIVMDSVRGGGRRQSTLYSPLSFNKPVPYYTGDPVGQDLIIHVPYCRACKVYIPREKDLEMHLRSEKHFYNCFDCEPGPAPHDDSLEVIEPHGRGHYDDSPLPNSERLDRREIFSRELLSNRELVSSRESRTLQSTDAEKDYFAHSSRNQSYDDEDDRNYRLQHQQKTMSPSISHSSRTIMEPRGHGHGAHVQDVDDRGNVDRVFRRTLLSPPPSHPVQVDETFEQEYFRHFDRSSPSQDIDSSHHYQNDQESSLRIYRRLPAAPPPPILRPPRDEPQVERQEIEFNAPKVMSRDWGKGGNKRGDYG